MNSKRSFLDSLNSGRTRRPGPTLDDLSRTLGDLESRLDAAAGGRGRDRDDFGGFEETRRARRLTGGTQTEAYHDHERRAYRGRGRPVADDYRRDVGEIERTRDRETTLTAIGGVARDLSSLRDDLRHQMTAGLRREFDTLRKDIERVYVAAQTGAGGGELTAELERLSDAIQALSSRGEDRGLNMLRLDVEQLSKTLDGLAREETVQSLDRRWEEFDRRWQNFEQRTPAAPATDPAIEALAERLGQIESAVNDLPESLSLHSLEDKVRTLAAAIDHFSRQSERAAPSAYEELGERLDEISRAISTISTPAPAAPMDTQPFERIEARISTLARQIEELTEDRPELVDRLSLLSSRVDDIAQRVDLPQRVVEKLMQQIERIADKIDAAPAGVDADAIMSGLEGRLTEIAGMLERKQDNLAARGQSLFEELDRRLDQLADRLERREPAASTSDLAIMEAIDARFQDLSERLHDATPRNDPALLATIDRRIEDLADRIDSASSRSGDIDPKLIRSLEEQIAGLARHLAEPGPSNSADTGAIGTRLDDIERSLSGNRETLIKAAREAADIAVRSLSEGAAAPGETKALADDLKTLETLAKRSDERNSRTFEAIHDTLLKVVDRLAAIEGKTKAPAPLPTETIVSERRKLAAETTPALAPVAAMAPPPQPAPTPATAAPAQRRSPAEAAAAAALAAVEAVEPEDGAVAGGSEGRRSLLGGLSRVLTRKEKTTATAEPVEPSLAGMDVPSLDAPLAADQPLEPGSGAPDLNAIIRRVRDERGGQAKSNDPATAKADFIAAARRAAQAAAAEAETFKRSSDGQSKSRRFSPGEFLRARRKPLLMGVAAIMIALAGLQLGKAFFLDGEQVAADGGQPLVAQQMTADDAEPEVEDDGIEAMDDGEFEPVEEEAAVRVVDGEGETSDVPEELDAGPMEMAKADARPAAAASTASGDAAAPQTAAAPASATINPARMEPTPVEAGPIALREAADEGDPKAMFEIGSRYADGRGVTSDMAAAAKWYERSAELGFAPAQYRIGNFYEKGIGVSRDVKQAKTWYQLAANQGNASAMHNLAVLFAMGADGTTDNESAARWFVEAAELGVKDSQFNLGILSAKGIGVPQSLEESYKWFALVAKTGDKDAAEKRDEVANALRPEQLTKARAAVELWKAKPVKPEANAIDIPESWQESPAQTASIDMKKAIQTVQIILNKNGYQAGGADGIMGEKTKAAIASFQRDNGLEATGEVDDKLVQLLLEKK